MKCKTVNIDNALYLLELDGVEILSITDWDENDVDCPEIYEKASVIVGRVD